jgi:hypothetical protein
VWNGCTLTWDHQGPRPLTQTEPQGAGRAPQEDIGQRFYAIVAHHSNAARGI